MQAAASAAECVPPAITANRLAAPAPTLWLLLAAGQHTSAWAGIEAALTAHAAAD